MSAGSKRKAISQLLANKNESPIQETINKEINIPVNTGINKPVNTEINKSVNVDKKKEKTTFEFDEDFKRELKIYAASKNKKMVEIVVEATKEYMKRNP